jgi:hypothetical protein
MHADGFGVSDEGAHIHILWPTFCAAELERTGPNLFSKLGLGETFALPLIGELETNTENRGFTSSTDLFPLQQERARVASSNR